MIGGDPDRQRDWRGVGIVVLAAVLAYATALLGDFVYDDHHAIVTNPALRSWRNALAFFVDPALFSGNGSAMYRPVLMLTLLADWQLGAGAAWPFKLTNLLLHAADAALLLMLLRRHSAARVPAIVAAVWFAVHPLASETVNFVSARSEALLLLGLLIAANGHAAWRRGTKVGSLLVLVGTVVACGSKETGVVVPALLLGAELLEVRGPGFAALRTHWRPTLLRALPAVLVAIVYLAVRKELLGQATATLVGRVAGDPTIGATRDLSTQLATMGLLLPRALLQIAMPHALTIDPPVFYVRSLGSPAAMIGWGSLLLATVLALRHGRARPVLTFGIALAWATALPWVLIPLNTPLAEHRLYGPLAGIAMALAAGLERVVPALRARWSLAATRRRQAVAAAVVATALGAASATRSLLYRDQVELWRAALAVDPMSFRAHWGLGTALFGRGDYHAAQSWLLRAVALQPNFRVARANCIEALLRLPKDDDWPFLAVAMAIELERQKPDDPYYRLLQGNALLAAGSIASDRELLQRAEAKVLSCHAVGAPKITVFRIAAECRRRLQDPAGALAHYDAARAAGLESPALRAERSEVLRELGRVAEAEQELRAAVQQAPFDPAVQTAVSRRTSAAPR